MNKLFFGDNLHVLREHVADESVDLIYLDPPFNSQARYNVLFKSPREDVASAQVGAFLDFWSWETGEAEGAYHEIMTKVGGPTAGIVQALRTALGESDLMAYLVMMALRFIELRRVLRTTGTLYLHCDPTASHYLKILLDAVFGGEQFLSEVIWKRTGTHSSARRWGPVHDVLLVMARRSGQQIWNRLYVPYSEKHLASHYRKVDQQGRRFEHGELTAPGTRNGRSGVAWRGFDVASLGRHWTTTVERLEQLFADGLIYIPSDGGWPRLIRYRDEAKGSAVGDVWDDIPPINMRARERLGYPTQKPAALLERVIGASSDDGQTVLDPFCGCGTTVHSAEKLGRRWIGIDVSIHAVHVIEQRIRDAFGASRVPRAEGIPADYESAARLAADNPFQFQWWANYLVGVHVLKEVKRGADRGIDGEVFFPNGPGRPYGRMLTFVKGGRTVGPAMVREFRGVIEREKAEMGLFLCLEPPTSAMQKEAVVAGFADVVHGRLPRLQIVSIAEWFMGRRPQMPPLEHLPYAAFSQPKRPAKGKRPDPNAPELPLSFTNEAMKSDNVRHFNPQMVRGAVA